MDKMSIATNSRFMTNPNSVQLYIYSRTGNVNSSLNVHAETFLNCLLKQANTFLLIIACLNCTLPAYSASASLSTYPLNCIKLCRNISRNRLSKRSISCFTRSSMAFASRSSSKYLTIISDTLH